MKQEIEASGDIDARTDAAIAAILRLRASHAELLAAAKQALEAIDTGNEILAAGIALEAAIAAAEEQAP
jgi:hypothetical protein